jgi:hypothetical protein
MEYLHYRLNAGPEKRVKVTLSERANIRLLDTLSYYRYCARKSYQAAREYLDVVQADVTIPHRSQWHLVIDHGEYRGELKASVDVREAG